MRIKHVNRADGQDALHYAIMSVGGNDRHGRESTMSGHPYKRWEYIAGADIGTAYGDSKMTRADWDFLSRKKLGDMGLPNPRNLKGERLIRYIDRLAHANGFDAYTGESLGYPRYPEYIVANMKVRGAKVRRRGNGRLRSGGRRGSGRR